MLISGNHRQGNVPTVNGPRAKAIFASLHQAISSGLVRSCHDLSEGGLAVALAEMAFAGGLGVEVDLDRIPYEPTESKLHRIVALFSESNSRFICEVTQENQAAFEAEFDVAIIAVIGCVCEHSRLKISDFRSGIIDADINELKNDWQRPLNWS
jgi:phosphoribosylformylglycinamidine synthase